MTHGLLLFAHGARDARWARPFEDVARRIASRSPQAPVALAYLEFLTPNVAEAARALVQTGCTEVSVVPLFLGAGGHVRKDLPQWIEQLRARYPQVAWQLHPAIGEAESVVQAMADAALELLRAGNAPRLDE
jgi:sirohydrochlorin cobaltochelatase